MPSEDFFLDHGRTSLNFINTHTFPQMFPFSNLDDSNDATEAVTLALEIASDSTSRSLYSLGPHPALLLRILEWVWNLPRNSSSEGLRRLVAQWAHDTAEKYEGTHFGFLWKVASAAVSIPGINFSYEPVPAETVAQSHYWRLKASGSSEASVLEKYLNEVGLGQAGERSLKVNSNIRDVAIVCQRGQNPAESVKYGSLRATIELGRNLMKAGINVVVTGQGPQGLGFNDGGLYVAVPSKHHVAHVVKLLEPLDLLVGISRGDILVMGKARRYLIYHHNASPADVYSLRCALNALDVPVVTVSEASKRMQQSLGIRSDLLKVVPNGVDNRVFNIACNDIRLSHSLIYAAHVVGTKGFDTALAAFRIIKAHFPDASFDAYGKVFSPPNLDPRLMDPGWLNSDGYPDWELIEAHLPGFRYGGEVTQAVLAEAFRQHSFLVLPATLPEPLNLVCLEAQACGCIPVLPRLGGFPETMRENMTGYLYDENTSEGLAAKILELWSQDLPTESQRIEAAQWVKQTFSWERTGRAMMELIESLPIKENGAKLPWKGFLRQLANIEREARRFGRGARFAVSTLKGKPPSQWPRFVNNLWKEYGRRRQHY